MANCRSGQQNFSAENTTLFVAKCLKKASMTVCGESLMMTSYLRACIVNDASPTHESVNMTSMPSFSLYLSNA